MSLNLTRVFTISASRRAVLGTALGAVGVAAARAAQPAHGAATPTAHTSATAQHLFVADAAEQSIAIFSIPDFTLTGTLEGVTFGTHGGTLHLPDGRLIFADPGHDEIVALRVDDAGAPVIAQRVAATLGGGVAWGSANDALTHVAFGSLVGDESETDPAQFLNIVDLATFENTVLEFAMDESEEITSWLTGDPLHVHVATGGVIRSYRFGDLADGVMEPLAEVAVDLASHGGVTDAARGRILYVAGPGTGFEVLDVRTGAAEYVQQIPWDLDGLTGGRNARPRVTADGGHVFGVMTPGLDDPTLWAETPVSNHITNLETLEARRLPIATGTVGYRWGLTDRYALWAGYDGTGAQAYLLDAGAASPTFGEVLQTVPVARPTHAAAAGEDHEGAEFYLMTAISPDSAYGFITISGDGRIEVIDLAALEIVAELETPTALAGGGYTTVMQTGAIPVDLWAR